MTEQQSLEHLDELPGDKVRIRRGTYVGQRGVICAIEEDGLTIEVESDVVVRVPRDDITNYSLAARRAWEKMPKRSGRPKSPKPGKKMVRMRIDREVWDRLGVAVD